MTSYLATFYVLRGCILLVLRVFLYKGEQAVSAIDGGLRFWLWETRALTAGCRMIFVWTLNHLASETLLRLTTHWLAPTFSQVTLNDRFVT